MQRDDQQLEESMKQEALTPEDSQEAPKAKPVPFFGRHVVRLKVKTSVRAGGTGEGKYPPSA